MITRLWEKSAAHKLATLTMPSRLRSLVAGTSIRLLLLSTVAIVTAAGRPVCGQDQPSPQWLVRPSSTRSQQPDWVTPLITASANLEEAVIYDLSRKLPSNGVPLVTAGSNRGIQFVPFGTLQITFATTPYLFHNNPHADNGFGDTQFAFKYRVISGNEHHGNYALSFAIGASVPTGSYQNGQHSGTIAPVVLGEKAWGPFDIQSTVGIQFPVSDTRLTGQPYTSNTAFQYRLAKRLWPELEENFSGNKGGPFDGKKQNFLLPGLFIGRFPLTPYMGLTFGIGMQIATTSYHTYNHNLLFSVRLPFESPGARERD
jgi:hypothetical protein